MGKKKEKKKSHNQNSWITGAGSGSRFSCNWRMVAGFGYLLVTNSEEERIGGLSGN